MRATRLLSVAALAAAMGGCASVSVKTDYNPQTDFAKYKTFAFKPPPEKEASVLRGSLTEQRIRQNTIDALALKGITENPARPDFLVAYHVVLQQKLDVDTWGYGWGPYWGPSSVTSYTQGTLILDFIDPATMQVFWRGTGTSVVNGGDEEDNIQDAVQKMLKDYPPKSAMPVSHR